MRNRDDVLGRLPIKLKGLIMEERVDKDSELVIGLVCAVGTEKDKVADIIKHHLQKSKYTVHEISISKDIITQVTNDSNLPKPSDDEFTRIDRLMTACNEARLNSRDNSILALGATAKIRYLNEQLRDNDITKREFRPRNAYIVSSLKHPEEVRQLRRIYPLGFYLFGVYANEADRHKHLTKDELMSSENATYLMKRDENENIPYGQYVADTFHMSDFFVNLGDSQKELKNSVERILKIMLGHPHSPPTFDEYAMFLAHAAALRSGSLSRQVGVVITQNNEIIATGANDCPRYGGGLYWPYFNKKDCEIQEEKGGRDYTRGEDSNHVQLQQIKEHIISKADLPEEYAEKLKEALDESPIKDLTEFGRSVHAEMEALLQCARNHGNSRGATLYTTLFSCHNCAKHIIAAGIERVVYIEPYPKSKATKLHDDAISLEFFKGKGNHNKVCFEPFVGIGPRRFFDLFSMDLGAGNKLIRRDSQKNH